MAKKKMKPAPVGVSVKVSGKTYEKVKNHVHPVGKIGHFFDQAALEKIEKEGIKQS